MENECTSVKSCAQFNWARGQYMSEWDGRPLPGMGEEVTLSPMVLGASPRLRKQRKPSSYPLGQILHKAGNQSTCWSLKCTQHHDLDSRAGWANRLQAKSSPITSCCTAAHKLRMGFMFLSGWGRKGKWSEYLMTSKTSLIHLSKPTELYNTE